MCIAYLSPNRIISGCLGIDPPVIGQLDVPLTVAAYPRRVVAARRHLPPPRAAEPRRAPSSPVS
jgi:hypothetical protein